MWAGLSQAGLPVDRQVQAVQGVERVGNGGVQFQLGQQGEVVRGDVGVGAAGDVVVHQPLAVQRAQDAHGAHVCLGEEDVVDDTLREQKRRSQRAPSSGEQVNSFRTEIRIGFIGRVSTMAY